MCKRFLQPSSEQSSWSIHSSPRLGRFLMNGIIDVTESPRYWLPRRSNVISPELWRETLSSREYTSFPSRFSFRSSNSDKLGENWRLSMNVVKLFLMLKKPKESSSSLSKLNDSLTSTTSSLLCVVAPVNLSIVAYFCPNWNIVPYATRTHTPGNTWYPFFEPLCIMWKGCVINCMQIQPLGTSH